MNHIQNFPEAERADALGIGNLPADRAEVTSDMPLVFEIAGLNQDDTCAANQSFDEVQQRDAVTSAPLMERVDIGLIQEGQRIRTLNHQQVEALEKSIADVGLLHPLMVFRCPIARDGQGMDGFGLIAGAHRLAACRNLGHTDVSVVIVEMDELHRTIAECDENLCGTQLSAAERAEFTDRRKRAYEQLHPEAANGATGNGRGKVRQVGEATSSSEIKRFTADTAAKTGQSERAVQRDAERGAKVSGSALALVSGTELDTGTYLDRLKTLPPSEQEQRVRADLKSREDERREGAALTKTRLTGTFGKTAAKQSMAPNGPSQFAAHLEELVAFRRVHFEEWRTMGRECQEAIKRALAYADSAVKVIKHFQDVHAEANHLSLSRPSTGPLASPTSDSPH